MGLTVSDSAPNTKFMVKTLSLGPKIRPQFVNYEVFFCEWQRETSDMSNRDTNFGNTITNPHDIINVNPGNDPLKD